MERRAMTRFFTLKGLESRAIHTELGSVYDQYRTARSQPYLGCPVSKETSHKALELTSNNTLQDMNQDA
jgi:hypothetical protein